MSNQESRGGEPKCLTCGQTWRKGSLWKAGIGMDCPNKWHIYGEAREPVPGESAASSNYVCNDDTFPTEATFSNGRVVKIAWREDGRPFLMISPKSEYPKPCGVCAGIIQSKDDLEWHGYGNCREIPEAIFAQSQSAEVQRLRERLELIAREAEAQAVGRSSFGQRKIVALAEEVLAEPQETRKP